VPSSRSQRRWPLVGRSSELELIARARSAGASGVVVIGGAGVGKSRLAREALQEADQQGVATKWVQATVSAASVPLAALSSLIASSAPANQPRELIRSITRAIAELAGRKPPLLVVDDAQSLDPSSAAVLLELAMHGGAFVLATVRAGEPCPDAITSLWKDADADRLELDALDVTETAVLAEAIVGGPIEQAAQGWIYDTSLGNALYVRELMLGALASGALDQISGLWRLPVRPPVSASLTELIAVRMTGLSQLERDALELLALGEPLLLSEMITMAATETLMQLEDRGLIQVSESSSPAVTLAHPLYGETIRTNLPTFRARQGRLKLAAVVRQREQPGTLDQLRVVRWLLDAGEEIDTGLLLEAAQAANLAGEPSLAGQLAQQAVNAGAGVPAALVLARAHSLQNQYGQARQILADVEPTLDDQDVALDYLEQQSEVLYWGLNQPDELAALMARAESWWTTPQWQRRLTPLRLRAAAHQSPAAPLSATAASLADADGDSEAQRQLAPLRAASLFYSGQTREAYTLARQIRPSVPLRDLTDQLAFMLWSVIAIETGQGWKELDSWATNALADGVRLGDSAAAGRGALALGGLRFSQGRFNDSQRWLAEAELQLERHDAGGLLLITKSMQVGIACFTGNLPEVTPALERCRAALADKDPLPNQLPYLMRAEAWAAHAEGDPPRAQQLLLDTARQLADLPIYAGRLTYEALRAGASARRLTPMLAELTERCDAPLLAAYAAHAAALAASNGQKLLETTDEMESIGALRYATEAAAHAASAFAAAGRRDSARRAATRSHDLHARGQGGIPPRIEGMDHTRISLTKREQQLVDLASRGLSNAQIADRLVLSIRTVESHLYRAMQKLGISDRQEL